MSKRDSLTNWLKQYADGYVTKAEAISALADLLIALEREAFPLEHPLEQWLVGVEGRYV